MAAKTIQETVTNILCVGPLSTIRERALGELRDFFAHRCQIYGAQNNCEEAMIGFFDSIFKDIRAFNVEKKND